MFGLDQKLRLKGFQIQSMVVFPLALTTLKQCFFIFQKRGSLCKSSKGKVKFPGHDQLEDK